MKTIQHIQIARVTIETRSPLSIGSGETDVYLDMPLALDANGLPYLPGTSIAGVLRSAYSDIATTNKDAVNQDFGYQSKAEGQVSKLRFGSGHLIGETGKVAEGLLPRVAGFFEDPFLNMIRDRGMETRERVRINHRGTALHQGKFDISLLVPGVRFVFDIKYFGSADAIVWNTLLDLLNSGWIRFGRNTRNGYGAFEVVQLQTAQFDLAQLDDLKAYAGWSGSYNAPLPKAMPSNKKQIDNGFVQYEVQLQPDDFFMFSSGKKGADDDAPDMSSLTGSRVVWESGKPRFKEAEVIVPGSSVKGALAHRTLFHYYKNKGTFAGKKYVDENPDVRRAPIAPLFGAAAGAVEDHDEEKEKKQNGWAGAAFFSDVYLETQEKQHIDVAHVSLDRLTQGNIQGALYQEQVIDLREQAQGLRFTISVKPSDYSGQPIAQEVMDAFHAALNDLTNGFLPLGGGVNRGHGRFHGTYTIKKQNL
ncbi:MAG: RAMP superfamily CRISPR-associated protein [Schleiferiaceae bacterium]|nr:RAMP superfamily CRISPR-associated protein [Schleiferiaceae bacterium]